MLLFSFLFIIKIVLLILSVPISHGLLIFYNYKNYNRLFNNNIITLFAYVYLYIFYVDSASFFFLNKIKYKNTFYILGIRSHEGNRSNGNNNNNKN